MPEVKQITSEAENIYCQFRKLIQDCEDITGDPMPVWRQEVLLEWWISQVLKELNNKDSNNSSTDTDIEGIQAIEYILSKHGAVGIENLRNIVKEKIEKYLPKERGYLEIFSSALKVFVEGLKKKRKIQELKNSLREIQ